MLKKILFQTHWLVGITAGVVLAVVGITGALLSYEGEIQAWLNRDVRRVDASGQAPLPPPQLITAVQRQLPGRQVLAVAVSSHASESARVTLALTPEQIARLPPQPQRGGVGGRGGPPAETRYAHPVTGELFTGEGTRGQAFFRTTRSIHRWLAAGTIGNQEVGKHIVGASTLLCVLLVFTGLYLRWPRRWSQWRSWLALDWRLKGRSFLWHLHAVVGTWVLPLFLLMSLTGLYWSYEWYRNGLFAMAGVEPPPQRGGPTGAEVREGREARNGRDGPGRDAPGRRPREGASPPPPGATLPPTVDLDRAWATFLRESADTPYLTANVTLPQSPDRPLEIRYLPADAPHDRAANTLSLDAATISVLKHDRYRDKRAGERFMSSIFPLHSGSFFGWPGVLMYMVASLMMPLFAITGWMLYLDRRRKKRAANAMRDAAVAGAAANPGEGVPLLVVHASQTGVAREIAWQSASALRSAGVAAEVVPAGELTPQRLCEVPRALFVLSTFGQGEPPDEARSFDRKLVGTALPLTRLEYGVLALGDRRYDTFCEFGRRVDHWLIDNGAKVLFPRVEVDNAQPQALARWRDHVRALAPDGTLELWHEPRFESWTLAARTLLNPGSIGGPTYHVELAPPSPCDWEAGDIAVVQPANAPREVDAFVQRHRFEPATAQADDEWAAAIRRQLALKALDPARVVRNDESPFSELPLLPLREFSVASLPSDGRVHLVIRQAHRPDGKLGVGSGWLTVHARVGDKVLMRLRANAEFRAPLDDRPLILIGNGTGIAGLRALMKARAAAGRRRNWLVFGERRAAHDFYYRDEIQAWQREGYIEHLDLAFSRDQLDRIYVQHRLHEQAERLRVWVSDGAVVCVCGSAEGMAPAVEAALIRGLGEPAFRQLVDAKRYRRDVY